MTIREYESYRRSTPRYSHNCDRCVFLGQYEDFDLYACGHKVPEAEELADSVLDTVIARKSDDPCDYASGLNEGYIVPPSNIKELNTVSSWRALTLACKLALLSGDFYLSNQVKMRIAEIVIRKFKMI